MRRFLFALAFSAASAGSASSQTVRDFLPEFSGVSAQGSKLWLVFERFTIADPMDITLGQDRLLSEVSFDISYPTYGNASVRQEDDLVCKRLTAFNRSFFDSQQNEILATVLVCHLDGDIHNADDMETDFTLLEGWAVGDNEKTGAVTDFTPPNNSAVDYPKPIVSWDMVPHQIVYPIDYLDSENPEPFHVDLVVLHRYSFEHSEYGDARVEVWIDENQGFEDEPPTTGAVLSATARPAYKVPQRDDIQSGTYLVYRASFDPAEFIEDSAIVDGPAYVHFKVTPSRGDADSILVSPAYDDEHVWRPDLAVLGVQPNIETMKVFMNGGETLDTEPRYAVVDPDPMEGDDTTGAWSTTIGTARANPFRTIFRAVQAMPADLVNPIILLRDGKFWPGRDPEDSISGNGLDKAGGNWLTIMPDLTDGVTRAQVEITDVAFIVSSSAPGNPLFSITNDSGVPLEWRWQSGDDEGLAIRHKTSGARNYDVLLSRAGLTVAQMVTAINENEDLENAGVSATGLNFTGFRVDAGDLYYDEVSAFVEIADEDTEDILANSVVRTGQGTNGDEVHIFSELKVEEITVAEADDMLELETAIEGLFANMEVEVIHNVDLETLQTRLYRIPAIFPNPDHNETWFEADMNGNGLRYPFVRYQDCTIRSVTLESNPPNDPENEVIPHHLWIDHCILESESKVSVDSKEIIGIPGDWTGGAWYTGCDFNTMRQTTNGPVMVRDAHFLEIGGDTGKQVSYAMNWFGENVARVAGDLVHPDYFQWSPDKLEDKNTHGNIIAVNLDFRDVDNDGQPFLFNVPGNDNISHTYRGIALVNLRMNAPRTQQICGNVDHLLLWDSDVFQGGELSRRVHLRGVPREEENISTYHNVSIRNAVVENLRTNGASGENNDTAGDMPSLWSIIDSCFITDELLDEFEMSLTDEIETMHDSIHGGSPADLVNLATDWSPKISGVITLLIDRLKAEDIVYRMDAAGTERLIDPNQMVAAVGALEDHVETEGQPSELNAYVIEIGSLSTAGVPDDNPLSMLVLSDDRKLSVLFAGLSPVVELFVVAKTRVASPATIDLVFEGRLSSGTMTNGAKLALWDWNAMPPAWVDQDTFTISTTESVRTKTGITPTNYIEAGTGMIKYRLRLAPSNWINPDFTVQTDQMKIVVKD